MNRLPACLSARSSFLMLLEILLFAYAGHAASVSFAVPPELSQWAHFAAAGLWVGGLVLALLLVRETATTADVVSPIRRYSTLAAWAVLVVVLTGLLRAWSQLGGPGGIVNALDVRPGPE